MKLRPVSIAALLLLSVVTAGPAAQQPAADAASARAGTVLITGTNRGLGLELVRQYAARGWTVVATARNPETATDLRELAARSRGVSIERLDVLDRKAIAALAARYAGRPIDVLINNAGVHGPVGDPGALAAAEVLEVFNINLVGAVRTTTAFLPLLRRSADPVIINVSSQMGSLAATHDPSRAESRFVAPAILLLFTPG